MFAHGLCKDLDTQPRDVLVRHQDFGQTLHVECCGGSNLHFLGPIEKLVIHRVQVERG
ncbi:MAG: hypothetical protein HYU36_07605 [Planctomycetes bacterium]|nr:hypothetical protein [Planctomycetota bacterium]